jgi:hypothetical protein
MPNGNKSLDRIQYNNLIFHYLLECERVQWDTKRCKDIYTSIREHIPTLLSVCNAHTVIAVSRWIKSNDRPSNVRNIRKQMNRMLLALFHNGTKKFSLSQTLVHLGLFIYMLEKPYLNVSRNDLVVKRSAPFQHEVDAIETGIKAFVSRMIH